MKLAALIACAGACALLAAAPATAGATSVSIGQWHVYTGSELHKVKPGHRFNACASSPTTEADAKGKVKGAKKGHAFDEIWSLNGKQDHVVHASWGKGGNFTDYFGLFDSGNPVATGKWKLKLVQGSKTIGKSSITLATKQSC
jgi:hypothetical protein